MKKHTLTTLFTDFSITKNAFLLLLLISLYSCKKDVVVLPQAELITETVASELLLKTVKCNDTAYTFEMPYFKATPAQEALIHKDLMGLLAPYVNDNTISENRSFKDVYDDFIASRKNSICENKKSGISNIKVEHLSQNDAVLSYEITYKSDNKPRRLIRAYKKPDLSLLTLKNLVKKERLSDVQRIMDINTQNSVIELALEIPSQIQKPFRDFSMNTAFTYDNILEKEIPVGVNILEDGKMKLQFPKTVDLPAQYPDLNGDIKIDIEADQLSYYMNLSLIGG